MKKYGLVPEYLEQLGFTSDEIAVYTTLVTGGSMTMSDLSRKSGVERTALYRMVDELQIKGLIRVQNEQKRKIIYPAQPYALTRLVDQEEIKLHGLRQQQATFQSTIEEMMGSRTDTDINYYRGVEGIKQIQWKMLNCKSKTIYSVRNTVLDQMVESEFFDHWGKRFLEAKLRNKVIYSDGFITSMQQHHSQLGTDPLDGVEYYYVDHATFDITHDFDTYDDYVIYYNWGDEDPYAVEVRDRHIAYSTRQFIELFVTNTSSKPKNWKQLKKNMPSIKKA